jgi:hypothetical protein
MRVFQTGIFSAAGGVLSQIRASAAFRDFIQLTKTPYFYLCLLAFLSAFCAADFFTKPQARRVYWFCALDGTNPIVEERFLPSASSLEKAVEQYVSEFLLGPASIGAAPLFNTDATLDSFIFRDGEAYIGLPRRVLIQDPVRDEAVERTVYDGVRMLKSGILRNFPNVKTVKVFAGGLEIIDDSTGD